MMTQDQKFSGFQVAFLAFAVALLAAPFVDIVSARAPLSKDEAQLLSRLFIFLIPLAAVLAFPKFRRACEELLAAPMRREHAPEILAAAGLHLASNFGMAGALAVMFWLNGGSDAVARHVFMRDDLEAARAFSWVGLASLPVIALLAPLVEEVTFRGFMLRAWTRHWGWIAGMLLTAVAFGLFHPYAASAAVSSVIYTCVVRRTGSLWPAMVVHGISNLLLWYPFAGQFILPSDRTPDIGSLAAWGTNLACLAFVVVAVPLYVWMARDRPHG